jgi:hypothetical protein
MQIRYEDQFWEITVDDSKKHDPWRENDFRQHKAAGSGERFNSLHSHSASRRLDPLFSQFFGRKPGFGIFLCILFATGRNPHLREHHLRTDAVVALVPDQLMVRREKV